MTNYLVFLGLGKLLIYMCQTAGILEPVWSLLRTLEIRCRGHFAFWPADHDLVDEFQECGFCLGVYIFSFLAIYARINVFDFFPDGLIACLLTAVSSSFIVHLLDGGYRYHFGE